MKKDVIGIVGQGFVGTAIKAGMSPIFNVQTYDKFKPEESTCENLDELAHRAEIIFICLPTPMKKTGECDLNIVKDTIMELDRILAPYGASKTLIIKSTVPPGTTKKLNEKCSSLQVVFNPEFLTEANYIEDFRNQSRIVIGGPRPATTLVKHMYRKRFPMTPIIKTGATTAELVKYFTNCFLATKVSFANEFKQICNELEVDYDKVVEYALHDERIGRSHFSTPGPDGKLGFGGSCFPKDLNAFIYLAISLGVEPAVLRAVWNKNIEVRPEKDWENLKGRAVSE
jgi:UDPglucose 6-dehydrogenase